MEQLLTQHCLLIVNRSFDQSLAAADRIHRGETMCRVLPTMNSSSDIPIQQQQTTTTDSNRSDAPPKADGTSSDGRPTTPKGSKQKRKVSRGKRLGGAKLKKDPNAPRRFKSAFIFFSTEKHKEIRKQLGKQGAKEKVGGMLSLW